MGEVSTKSLIHLEKISREYREGEQTRTVFKDFTFDFHDKAIHVLLGKSGSGKSTLLNLLAGIDAPDSGSIWINGENLTTMNEKARTRFRRENIGFIFQFFNLIPVLTVRENILLPLQLNGLDSRENIDYAFSLLSDLGLGDREKAYPDHLSGGEQQRVAIVRALAHKPSLILADEPTGNLDEKTGAQILNLLQELMKEHQKTLLMVTHSREAAAIGHHVYEIHDGVLRGL